MSGQDDQAERSLQGLGNLIGRITPWLFAVGSWIFGGLIAADLVVLSSLIAVGPADGPVLIAITAFACALPLNVAGVFLLRLTNDMNDIGIDDLALQSFQDAGFPDIEAYFPPSSDRESHHKNRAILALRYALGIAALSIALTLTGLVAALWHIAWWVGVTLFVMVILSTVLVIGALAHSLPAESKAEMERRRRQR